MKLRGSGCGASCTCNLVLKQKQNFSTLKKNHFSLETQNETQFSWAGSFPRCLDQSGRREPGAGSSEQLSTWLSWHLLLPEHLLAG